MVQSCYLGILLLPALENRSMYNHKKPCRHLQSGIKKLFQIIETVFTTTFKHNIFSIQLFVADREN